MPYTFLQRLGNHYEKGEFQSRRWQKTLGKHSKESVHTNSQLFCQYSQELSKHKTGHLSAWRRELGMQLQLRCRSQVLGKEKPFLSNFVCSTDKLTVFQWRATYQRLFGQHKLAFMEGKKNHKVEWERIDLGKLGERN